MNLDIVAPYAHGPKAWRQCLRRALFQQEMPEIFVGWGAFEEDGVGHNHAAILSTRRSDCLKRMTSTLSSFLC